MYENILKRKTPVVFAGTYNFAKRPVPERA